MSLPVRYIAEQYNPVQLFKMIANTPAHKPVVSSNTATTQA